MEYDLGNHSPEPYVLSSSHEMVVVHAVCKYDDHLLNCWGCCSAMTLSIRLVPEYSVYTAFAT
jgi:hypothetical protein